MVSIASSLPAVGPQSFPLAAPPLKCDDMNTAAVHKAGVQLFHNKLLEHGINSSDSTAGTGIDVVMYLPGKKPATTIQVRAIEKPGPAGGKGKPARGWVFPQSSADWLACADLSIDSAWLFRMDEAHRLAQQHWPNGHRRLYWYIDDAPLRARRQIEMEPHRIDTVAQSLLYGPAIS